MSTDGQIRRISLYFRWRTGNPAKDRFARDSLHRQLYPAERSPRASSGPKHQEARGSGANLWTATPRKSSPSVLTPRFFSRPLDYLLGDDHPTPSLPGASPEREGVYQRALSELVRRGGVNYLPIHFALANGAGRVSKKQLLVRGLTAVEVKTAVDDRPELGRLGGDLLALAGAG